MSIPPPESTPVLPVAVPPAAAQPAWQAPPPQQPYQVAYPPAQYYGDAPQHSKTLGVVAFVAGLAVLIVSPIVSAVTGTTLGHLVQPGSGFAAGFAAGANSRDPQTLVASLLIWMQLLLGSGVGVWALVQGIVAVRVRRGRSWGIAAIVFAGVAPFLSFIVFIIASAVAESAG